MIPAALQKQIAHVAIKNYAAHSYLYYEKDSPVISDGDYDELCKWLLENFDWIKPIDVSGYLDKESLKAGTGMHLHGKVCGLTLEYALSLLDDHRGPRREPWAQEPVAEAPPEPKKKKKKKKEIADWL